MCVYIYIYIYIYIYTYPGRHTLVAGRRPHRGGGCTANTRRSMCYALKTEGL